MGHYAKIVDGTVVDVIRADAEFFETFVDESPGEWVKTSYNTRGGMHYDLNVGELSEDQSKALRKNYATIGGKYDGTGFYEAQPYASWTLNSETYFWEPPIAMPELTQAEIDDNKIYDWDEDAYQADNTQGWVLRDRY